MRFEPGILFEADKEERRVRYEEEKRADGGDQTGLLIQRRERNQAKQFIVPLMSRYSSIG